MIIILHVLFRLSTALAKLNAVLDTLVEENVEMEPMLKKEDVEEALRLMNASKEQTKLFIQRRFNNKEYAIYELLKLMLKSVKSIALDELIER